MSTNQIHNRITEIARKRGFYWPSFEIYGGHSGFITYGDLGTKLKRNIENAWRKFFVRNSGFLELDAPLINVSRVFEASGHLENFKEHSVECSECGRSFRSDHLIEEKTGLDNVEALGREAINKLLSEHKIMCPRCGGKLKNPVMFLTMFKTNIGATGGEVGYARPETAQGMFINFKRGFLYAREKLPFALSQVGKVLRNEISPRRGMIRLREFTIMELELFFDPQQSTCPWFKEVSKEKVELITESMETRKDLNPINVSLQEAVERGHILTQWQAYFMGVSKRFISYIGIPENRQRFRAHKPEERSHYSSQTYDHEVKLDSWGWIEVAGHAYRTDFDLKAHQNGSGVDMTVLRPDGSRFIPHVVEPSFGLDRLMYVILESSYRIKKKRNILAIPRDIVPIQVSVFPLVTKDGLPERAYEVYRVLIDADLATVYDESGSIGRRYARSDEIGTPLAVTIDYDTFLDDAVTVRYRDDWKQIRIKIDRLPEHIQKHLKKID